MISISKEFRFDAAHFLPTAEKGHPNSRVHGHSYTAQLTLEGAADPKDQMGFTHLFAMDYLPGEEHVIPKPRDYDFWRGNVNSSSGRSKLTVTRRCCSRSSGTRPTSA